MCATSDGGRDRSGRRSREKGKRGERAVVDLFKRFGFHAHRILNAEATGSDPGDVVAECLDLPVEVKNREDIPKRLWEWLEGKGALFIKRNNYPWLMVIEAEQGVRLMRGNDGKRSNSEESG